MKTKSTTTGSGIEIADASGEQQRMQLRAGQRPSAAERRPYFLRTAVAHIERYIENDREADIGNPAVLLQQVRDEVSGKAHQGNRKAQTEYQDKRMFASSTSHRQYVVE